MAVEGRDSESELPWPAHVGWGATSHYIPQTVVMGHDRVHDNIYTSS